MTFKPSYAAPYIENEAAYERAIDNRIRANRAKTASRKFREENADAQAIIDYICNEAERGNPFWAKIEANIEEWGAPQPRIIEIVRERIATREQRRAEAKARDAGSVHVGEVGKRQDFVLTLRSSTAWETPYGLLVINVLTDDQGNVIVYKGRTPGYETADGHWHEIQKGETVKVKATVKEHGVRDEIRQTIIARPKWQAA